MAHCMVTLVWVNNEKSVLKYSDFQHRLRKARAWAARLESAGDAVNQGRHQQFENAAGLVDYIREIMKGVK